MRHMSVHEYTLKAALLRIPGELRLELDRMRGALEDGEIGRGLRIWTVVGEGEGSSAIRELVAQKREC